MNKPTQHLFDDPNNIKRLLHLLYACCLLLLLLDVVVERHTSHPWEQLWGFYSLYGFAGCVVLVLIAKALRLILQRPPDYYLPAPPHQRHDRDMNHVDG